MTAERPAIQVKVCEGYYLLASGIKRTVGGKLGADLLLTNSPNPSIDSGQVLYSNRCAINLAADVDAWAAQATGDGRPAADEIALTIIAGIYPEVLADLQADEPKGPAQADKLVQSVTAIAAPPIGRADLAAGVLGVCELFHDQTAEPYATIPVDGHRETWPLASRGFKRWLARRYYDAEGKAPNAQALTDAIGVLAGKALFEGPLHPVSVRLAAHPDTIYLDLADSAWRVVEIDARGWRFATEPPVKFRRPKGMAALPEPVRGGTVAELRQFANVGSDDDWMLIASWLVAAFRPTGPYPVLILHGEGGSAKSTLCRLLRALIDPSIAAIRSGPRSEHDIVIAASNSWVLAYDNLSDLKDWLSDALCRLATGGGFSTRTLYENTEETIFASTRPILVNGIEEIATRGDLLDRSIISYLPTIPKKKRRAEKALWRDFERARPQLLGAVLDAVSAALKNEPTVTIDDLPRMADFALWAAAAAPALGWTPEAFLDGYQANRDAANDLTLDASVVSPVLRTWLDGHAGTYDGIAREWLAVLNEAADDATKKLKSWPGSGRELAGALRRLAPSLRVAGIDVEFLPREMNRRPIRIGPVGDSREPVPMKEARQSSSSPSSSSSDRGKGRNERAFRQDRMTMDDEKVGADDDGHRHREGDRRHASSSPPPPKPASQQGIWVADDDHDNDDDAMRFSANGRVSRDEARTCVHCGEPLTPDRRYACEDCVPVGERDPFGEEDGDDLPW